jgi:hypothetical protein
MRRFALLGLVLLLPGCQFAGNPLDGFGGFIGDTHTYHDNVNAPVAKSENERRVRGEELTAAPLLPEPGDVWPGPPAPIPTLQDVQKLDNTKVLPPPTIPSAPPPPLFQQNEIQPGPVTTPQGTVVPYNGGNNVKTFQAPGGGVGLIVPNANGTNTVIQPNGAVTNEPK